MKGTKETKVKETRVIKKKRNTLRVGKFKQSSVQPLLINHLSCAICWRTEKNEAFPDLGAYTLV